MAISELAFSSWPLSKQYLAAHYYLSEEKPISITESQRAQLGSLHLFVSFGQHSDNVNVPELNKCTPSEKKKRIEEWRNLGTISRSVAMKKFIDILTCLFPNWSRYRKLHYEFEVEWVNMQKAVGKGRSPLDVNPKELDASQRKTVSRSLSPIQASLRRPHKTIKDSVPKAVKAVTYFQKARILPYLPQVPKLNAAKDAMDTIYALKKEHRLETIHNLNNESIYYRFPKPVAEKKHKKSKSNFFDSFVEEIVSDTARTKEVSKKTEGYIEPFPELNFMNDLHKRIEVIIIQSMTNKLEEIELSYR